MTARLHTLLIVVLVLLSSCNHKPASVPQPEPAVYYWRTTLKLDSTERNFLLTHHVGKVYMRFFDVVMRNDKPMPNATLKVLDSLPKNIKIIPTIFITENCLRANLEGIPQLLFDRVMQMCQTNDLPTPQEIQIDCDWTARSQNTYFDFLQQLRDIMREKGVNLSTTIRLHQLSMPPPPVDYGVLMVYNTGDAAKINGHNPILDMRDVQPYLRNIRNYRLPLCAAYPVYGWQLLYDSKGFKAILHEEDMDNEAIYHKLAPDTWLVVSARDLPTLSEDASQVTWVLPGDTVRAWRPSAEQVTQVARALENHRPGINKQVVVYSLDTKNINTYNSDEYETIFHP